MNRHKSCKDSRNANTVGRARSTLSVSAVDYYLNLPVTCPPSPAVSTVTLTPGRLRNIDQDMENLRASRQDNPFIQQVIASRESLIDSLDTEEESDHANLMSKELSLDLDIDPLSLPEMHEHMIRSPPPTSWPKSPNFKVFQFPHGEEETISIEVNAKDSKTSELKPKHSSWDGTDTSPLRSLPKPHFHQDRFSLLTPGTLRPSGEDSIRLMAED
ncbi:uncharacterized protein LOC108905686 [Anoplophora glabripennis]|uniref:uncharacterized protein LOC108905686 n=1 Tax=Anoplophora glabripennis TaxID=217634 RepID=UPI000874BB86|nr:uncharacterized protein LOC108905686 [Anoplophora glabripennis]